MSFLVEYWAITTITKLDTRATRYSSREIKVFETYFRCYVYLKKSMARWQLREFVQGLWRCAVSENMWLAREWERGCERKRERERELSGLTVQLSTSCRYMLPKEKRGQKGEQIYFTIVIHFGKSSLQWTTQLFNSGLLQALLRYKQIFLLFVHDIFF